MALLKLEICLEYDNLLKMLVINMRSITILLTHLGFLELIYDNGKAIKGSFKMDQLLSLNLKQFSKVYAKLTRDGYETSVL